jgi:hypothetical protein
MDESPGPGGGVTRTDSNPATRELHPPAPLSESVMFGPLASAPTWLTTHPLAIPNGAPAAGSKIVSVVQGVPTAVTAKWGIAIVKTASWATAGVKVGVLMSVPLSVPAFAAEWSNTAVDPAGRVKVSAKHPNLLTGEAKVAVTVAEAPLGARNR